MASAKEFQCRVVSNRMVTPTVFELKFAPDHKMDFIAGQFASIVIPGAGPKGRDLRRAYSIASPPEFEHPEFCIKHVESGPGSSYLHQLEEGDIFKAFVPYGDFVFKTPSDRHVCFIATGTGIAPFRAMIGSKSYQANPPRSTLCLMGVRTEDELLYREELTSNRSIRVVMAVSQPQAGWAGHTGRVTDFLRTNAPDIAWGETDFYLCGNGAMIDETKQILQTQGVPKQQVHQEVYYKPIQNPS